MTSNQLGKATMSIELERQPISEEDIALIFFRAKLSADLQLQLKLSELMEAVEEARENGLIVHLYTNEDGDIAVDAKTKKKIGFDIPERTE